jgi:hypothetical protein
MNKIVTLIRLQSSCQTLILSVFYYFYQNDILDINKTQQFEFNL